MKPTPEKLLNIAQTHINSRMPTLSSRKNDRLDFYEVSVWSLEAALTAAVILGAKEAANFVRENGAPNAATKLDEFIAAEKE